MIETIGIDYSEFRAASTKAINENAFDIIMNDRHVECIEIAEKTWLFYDKKTYLKASKKWYQTSEFWNKVLLLVIGGANTILTTSIIETIRNKGKIDKQRILENRLDSLILETNKKK